MDIVRNTKIDWLGKKWYFIGASSLLAVLSALSLGFGGLNLGVDFTGGTLVYVKFSTTPDLERIRSILDQAQLGAEEVTRFDEPSANEVQIRMAQIEDEASEDLSLKGSRISDVLFNALDKEISAGKQYDLNRITRSELSRWLQEKDPEGWSKDLSLDEVVQKAEDLSERITSFRTEKSGIFGSFSDLSEGGVSESILKAMEEDFYLGSFTVISVESVGPKVGRELQERAQSAVFFSLIGMLIYIAFRFRPIYGLAAIVALFHDVFLTVGFFSLTGKEISLTVIAALLTLVGYSINDTIVIFDRVRENLRLMRRADFRSVVNSSINQTLNRTILTSGMTFMAVFALYMLGGEALSGFSFALVAGVIVGTYSSVAIASPIVLWWQDYTEKRKARR